MMTTQLVDALNKQMNFEFYSSHFYLAASVWANGADYYGVESWLERQALEEREHGMKFLKYIEEINEKVELSSLPAPQNNWDNLFELFKEAKRHEENVTRSIDALYGIAREEKSFATEVFLNFFVREQQEEVSRLQEICRRLESFAANPSALFLFDEKMKNER